MRLLIVESPNKIPKIKTILGPGWDVAASVGHIRDLPKSPIGIEAPAYALQYEFTERGREVVAKLKERVARAEAVYLATDADREGEAIAWHLQQALALRSYQRITFNAITETAIKAALNAPRQLDMNLVHSQEARRGTDRLVGYQVSPVLSRQTGIAKLSAGRVQTIALRFVVDRQLEIEAFRATKHFGAEASFDGGRWRARWDTTPFLRNGEEYILDGQLAQVVAGCRSFRVTAANTTTATEAPPQPFTTSTLLQAASVSLNMKPDETARVAQRLFEQGLITYHRTDSPNFSPESLSEIRTYAAKADLPIPAKPRTWKALDSAQGAHEAIRPTHLEDTQAGADEAEKRLYSLIWHRAIASQLTEAVYSVNTLSLEGQNASQAFTFKATGRTLKERGWRVLTAKDAAEEDESDPADSAEGKADDNGSVPTSEIGAQFIADSARVLNITTRPPKRYTQASLIKALEKAGVGRPSTFQAMVTLILTKGYVTESKKALYATATGVSLIQWLKGKFAFLEYDYTRNFELALDEISTGRSAFLDVVTKVDAQLQTELSGLRLAPQPQLATQRGSASSGAGKRTDKEPIHILCPKCKQGNIRVPRGQKFWGCSRYEQGCNFTINGIRAKKTLTENQVATLCAKGKTRVIKGFINAQGKPFDRELHCNEETGWQTVMKLPANS
jgi:DNA topoisomerase I